MSKVITSVKALINREGKFLILKEELHKGDVWDLPGGKIEYGESPEEALRREVKEELDLEIEIHGSVGVWYFFSQSQKHQVICHTYLCTPVGEVRIDTSKNPADEVFTDLRWLTIDEILSDQEIVLTESLRELLDQNRESVAPNDILIELHVPDFEVTKKFYTALGFEVVWQTPATDQSGYLVMKRGESVLAFYCGNETVYQHPYFQRFPKDTPRSYGVELAVFITDQPIEEFYVNAKEKFGEEKIVEPLITQPWGKRDFRMIDPFGFYLRFSEPDNILIE